MSPVGGTNFVFCSYGKFNPGYRDEKCPKGPQNTRGIAFRLVSDLTSAVENVASWTVPVSGLECSYGKNFQLGYRDLGRKNRDLGNRASPPSHMNTHRNFCKEKSGEARSRKPSQSGRPGSYEDAFKQSVSILNFPAVSMRKRH